MWYITLEGLYLDTKAIISGLSVISSDVMESKRFPHYSTTASSYQKANDVEI